MTLLVGYWGGRTCAVAAFSGLVVFAIVKGDRWDGGMNLIALMIPGGIQELEENDEGHYWPFDVPAIRPSMVRTGVLTFSKYIYCGGAGWNIEPPHTPTIGTTGHRACITPDLFTSRDTTSIIPSL